MSDDLKELNDLQKLIGYEFKDKSLLISAFTHSSYVNEHAGVANERLEFLGDCALNFLVGVKYYGQNRDAGEGVLSAMRASVVSRGPLSRIVDELGLTKYLRVGAGVDKTKFADKARSDVFEALLGAMYIDGGLEVCDAFLNRAFYGKVEPEHDYKSELQEYAVKHGLAVGYRIEPQKDGSFRAVATVGKNEFSGHGKTKRAAEIDAAKSALNGFLVG